MGSNPQAKLFSTFLEQLSDINLDDWQALFAAQQELTTLAKICIEHGDDRLRPSLTLGMHLIEEVIMNACEDKAAHFDHLRSIIAQIAEGGVPDLSPEEQRKGDETATLLSDLEEQDITFSRNDDGDDDGDDDVIEQLAHAELDLPDQLDSDMVHEFINEAMEHLSGVETGLLQVEQDPNDQDAINSVFRAFHTIKGVAGSMGLIREQHLAHACEDLLDQVRARQRSLDEPLTDALLAGLDTMRQLIQGLSDACQSGWMARVPQLPDLVGMLHHMAQHEPGTPPPGKRLGEILIEENIVAPESVNVALIKQHEQPDKRLGDILVEEGRASKSDIDNAVASQRSGKTFVSSTMKVDVANVDNLADQIGELVIAQNMLMCNEAISHNASREVRNLLSHLDRTTRSVQDMVTRLRMVPIQPIFQRMNRVVRDLSRKIGRPVEFTTIGDDIEIDKNLVDRLADPLIHMVRNAIDHGIESREIRERAGKPSEGHITLRAYRAAGQICIAVEDDGAGLNRDRILAKARDNGLIEADGEALDDEDVWQLIFHPGFSTAANVTDISGRGVGMDVVKRMVEDMRGQIQVQSQAGAGSTMTLVLPLTMAIIDGTEVAVGQETYIIPTLSVLTSLQLSQAAITSICERGRIIHFQGEHIPVCRLADMFAVGKNEQPSQRPMGIIVQGGTKKLCLEVDAVIGRHQVVLKSIGKGLPDIPGIGGSSINGQGEVCLVVDTGSLISLQANTTRNERASVPS